jgi:hypothetical protein
VLGICELDGERGASAVVWTFEEGRIEGVDVGGLGVALLASPGVRETKWRAVIHVDERATPAQHDALLKLVTGQLGGAFAELAALVGEIGAIERSPIRLHFDGRSARVFIGAWPDA